MKRAHEPLVSIIINNYNYARFLAAAIESALAQTYRTVEVIVVDDGSTDLSREVIERFSGQARPIYKRNGGQGSAYNSGFTESRGELVLYLDADDLLEPDAIEEMVKVWTPGVAKVHGYLRVVDREGKASGSVVPTSRLSDGDVREDLVRTGAYISPPATGNLYAREALEAILPMEEAGWRVAADTYPIFLSAFFGPVRACPRIVGSYRIHGSNQDAQTRVDAKLLHYRLRKENHRDEMLASFCAANGFKYARGSVQKQISHLKLKLASIVLDKTMHPIEGDTVWDVATEMLRRGWHSRESSLGKRFLIAGWIVALVAAPRSWKLKAVELGFVPIHRSRFLSGLMEPRTSKSERVQSVYERRVAGAEG